MKWSQDQVAIIDNGFAQFLSHETVPDIAAIRDSYKDCHPERVLYDIWRIVNYDLQFDNTHPAYSPWVDESGVTQPARVRRVQFNAMFKLYPKGCNDMHLQTVLRLVGRKHGLID